ncbi:tetratricopeptide repeat protein [Mongoliitalea daihaiensis]|uniref:tetratricopeptide repeat protein n=1 Tax=Mongoliitalea daihaiensis TaxID=2782006 RepID=UPI001F281BE6|nr:tetratricopeptide repeat protein [Mongoliitalea daihaiensis]UJP65661.1 tetratricopeptide repeat protein [Mongoliitalea daihaiensis]
MKKSQLIAIVIGVVAIGLLFSLPRVIVNNDEGESAISEAGNTVPSAAEDLHSAPIAPEAQEALQRISEQLSREENLEKFAAFTDTLASLYTQAGKFDSAAYFLDIAAERIQTLERFEKAGVAYYEAYTFALNEEKVAMLAEKTRFYLNKVLEANPARSDLKTRVAMTYVSSSNPMQGITMLREILDADPTNEDALFNMGILSMQSGQYRRAAERFEELVKHHPANIQGQFYLGVSYFESKQTNKAKKQFQDVKNMSSDPMILASVESYLERL